MKKNIFLLFLIFNIISYSGYYSVTVTSEEAGKQLVRLLEYKYIIDHIIVVGNSVVIVYHN
ncbi:Uncharacterised protein [Sebaldella termitidis]|uniref:Uncharacterized protein n=1 Tax=Sebaldella termitidis (strain ATCC 33386 / NCTC 11300) TaxID=526218 RepID=D1AMR8_SEBTE|nr:hypothetical protein [Sebaldella termitidis]ACZ09642.1 hypothetical protein Sterm_2798 [Sebaldella termitidis ATCC 33386]SUI24974.1 Uncharacterised protein [Sebaldella termitidis]